MIPIEQLGPWEENEGKWVVLTMGNPNERHGPALPRNLDDLHAIQAAKNLCFTSGARYGGHFPFTTDRVGEIAKEWSPRWIRRDTFYWEFRRWLPNILGAIETSLGRKTENILILDGHGGNQSTHGTLKGIVETTQSARCEVMSSLMMNPQDIEINLKLFAQTIISSYGGEMGFTDEESLTNAYRDIISTGGHAGHLEHTLGAAMGVMDWIKLNNLNGRLKDENDITVLDDYPALFGLAGYHSKYPSELGLNENDRYGLVECHMGVAKYGRVLVSPNLGNLLHRLALHYQMTLIQGEKQHDE